MMPGYSYKHKDPETWLKCYSCVFACFGCDAGFPLDPNPVFFNRIRIQPGFGSLNKKKEYKRGSKSDLLEENFKMTKDCQKRKKATISY